MGASSTHADDKNVSNEGSFLNELYLCLLLENAAKLSSNAKWSLLGGSAV